jgi:MFS family permease
MSSVNLWAVLVSALAAIAVGAIWYGPLFGKLYMREMGMDQWSQEKKDAMRKKMMVSYAVQFVASFVMLWVLAMFIGNVGAFGAGEGIVVALWVWIGFIVPLKLGDALWGGKMSLFWLGIFGNLATLVIAGAILGAWY